MIQSGEGGLPVVMDSMKRLAEEGGPVEIVDVGANRNLYTPPYQRLLDRGLCHVIGFEPHPEELARLAGLATGNETFRPEAIGDGREHTLHLTAQSGFTSVLEPDPRAAANFVRFSKWMQVVGTLPVQTHRLDDIEAVGRVDYLKIDIQGGELMALRGGRRKLADVLVVDTEVSFVPVYRDQPLWGDIDAELRGLGLIPHSLKPSRRMIRPLRFPGDPFRHLNQIVEADVVYVRDWRDMSAWPTAWVMRLAVVAHYAYRSLDLAARCVEELVRRDVVATAELETYLKGCIARMTPPA